MNTLFKEFVEVFESKFSDQKRWPAFKFIAKELTDKRKQINIVETGCARLPNNYDGDGQSTIMWDYLARNTLGFSVSFDINPFHVLKARAQLQEVSANPVTEVHHADSIQSLRLFRRADEVDLLYLDSYDWSEEKKDLSSLHCIGELAAIYDRLPSGCLIAIDDCHDYERGKHVMVNRFFEYANVKKEIDSYITIWRKA